MTRILYITILLLLLPHTIQASFVEGGKREFPILCNGVPCAIDSVNRGLYCSVKPVEGDSMKLVFSSNNITYLRINYKRYNMGDTVKVVNSFRRTYKLYIGGKVQMWTLYLTSLPIVMIEATRYEHEVYHHGYLNVIDPWKRTKNSVLFRQFIGARIRGAYTAGLPKKPYAIKLWDSNREGKNVSVLGLMKDENLILDAMYNDKARMRNRLCYDIWNQIDSLPYEVSEGHSKVNGTQGRYVEVFVDGAYNGVYCITDKINRKKLDLVKTESDANGKLKFHGVLYKATDWTNETTFNNVDNNANTTNTLGWRGWEQKYPDDSVQMANWNPLKILLKFTTPATNPNKTNFASLLRRKYYQQNLTNFMLMINLFHINDNHCKNTYVSFRDVNSATSVALITPWDLDASLGRNWDGGILNSFGFTNQITACGLFRRLFDGGPYYYRENFRDTWIRLKNSVLSPDSINARILAYKELLYKSGAWGREMNRWPGSMEGINTETSYMMDWYARSVNFTDSVLADFPSDINDVRTLPDGNLYATTEDGCIIVNSQSGSAKIAIYSSDGALIESADAQTPYRSRQLENGVYVVNVKTGNATLRKKVLIR